MAKVAAERALGVWGPLLTLAQTAQFGRLRMLTFVGPWLCLSSQTAPSLHLKVAIAKSLPIFQ
jgi:hypothetical protein